MELYTVFSKTTESKFHKNIIFLQIMLKTDHYPEVSG